MASTDGARRQVRRRAFSARSTDGAAIGTMIAGAWIKVKRAPTG